MTERAMRAVDALPVHRRPPAGAADQRETIDSEACAVCPVPALMPAPCVTLSSAVTWRPHDCVRCPRASRTLPPPLPGPGASGDNPGPGRDRREAASRARHATTPREVSGRRHSTRHIYHIFTDDRATASTLIKAQLFHIVTMRIHLAPTQHLL